MNTVEFIQVTGGVDEIIIERWAIGHGLSIDIKHLIYLLSAPQPAPGPRC